MSDTITNAAQGGYPTAQGRPSKVAIIGAGAVGSTLAYACVNKGVAREIVLQDIAKEKVEAEAMDIAQGIQFTSAGSVAGSDDPEICRGADVIAITAGAKQKPGQSRIELAGATVGMVSLETGTAVQNIHGYIAGEHGDSEVALWSSAQIGGVPLTQWGPTLDGGHFDQEKRDRIAYDVVRSAYRIIEGKGVTNYAVGLAVQRIISAVLNDEQRVLTISPLLEQWHGISDVCMSVPTIVGREGAGRRLDLPLTVEERDKLTESADRLRSVARSQGY